MKYGETLRQRSIPAWSHYNIDYDDIKHFIKERTTPGAGKTVSVPGRGDDKLGEFEQSLFHILADQHQRIDLFVRSKTGEIRRRLDHAKKQFRQLSMRRSSVIDRPGPNPGLDRYVRLENDVVKAGDELRSLARFTSTQRTAFRKLLKKYKKWTGSDSLEIRVRDEILDDPKSFTKLDFGPMLDDYSDTLHDIRSLFEATFPRKGSKTGSSEPAVAMNATPIESLSEKVSSNSKVDFDVAFDTVPLGEGGALASYFVHPDNIIELQILLLQHFRSYGSRSRASSAAVTPMSSSPRVNTFTGNPAIDSDFFLLAADNLDRFAQEQASVTVDEREHLAGTMPQKAKVCIRWNSEEEAVVSAKNGRRRAKVVPFKKKHVDAFFDRSTKFSERKVSFPGNVSQDLDAVREEVLKDTSVEPLYRIATSRARHLGVSNDATRFVLATLDTNIKMRQSDDSSSVDFPFALLQVRQEGNPAVDVLSILDQNHLVERVRGFSLQYHTLWKIYKPKHISPPFWMPILSRDIRKLPPPALSHDSAPRSPSATQNSSNNSAMGITDSTTAVENGRPSSNGTADQMEDPPVRAHRKKRRRQFVEPPASPPQTRYWSEYDHPEDGDGEDGGYVIYIDPNERSSLERMFDKMARLFRLSRKADDGVDEVDVDGNSIIPVTPRDDPTSSDSEDERTPLSLARTRTANGSFLSYGTLLRGFSSSTTTAAAQDPRRASLLSSNPYLTAPAIEQQQQQRHQPSITPTCLTASLIITFVAAFLAATSRKKYVREVDAAVLLAIVSSLIFALVGFAALFRRVEVGFLVWCAACGVVVVDAVVAGALIAWMVG